MLPPRTKHTGPDGFCTSSLSSWKINRLLLKHLQSIPAQKPSVLPQKEEGGLVWVEHVELSPIRLDCQQFDLGWSGEGCNLQATQASALATGQRESTVHYCYRRGKNIASLEQYGGKLPPGAHTPSSARRCTVLHKFILKIQRAFGRMHQHAGVTCVMLSWQSHVSCAFVSSVMMELCEGTLTWTSIDIMLHHENLSSHRDGRK